VLNFDHSTLKHALQNSRNDYHQRLSHSFRVHQSRLRLGLCPGSRWGSLLYSAGPDPLSGLRGTVLLTDQKVARLYDIGRFTLQTDPRDMLYTELNAQCDKVSKVADSS